MRGWETDIYITAAAVVVTENWRVKARLPDLMTSTNFNLLRRLQSKSSDESSKIPDKKSSR